MSLPTTVTQRAEGNVYVGNTGMTVVAQTGFAIRTGFYITNSGNFGVNMSVEDISTPPNEGIFDFVSGVNEEVTIPAGSTKFIEFDFYAVKENYNTGAISGIVDLSFISERDGFADDTSYSGPQPRGVIRNYITGLAAGYVDVTGPVVKPNPAYPEFVPLHPSGFLVLTGEYTAKGKPINKLHWEHPAKDYYFEKYEIQVAEANTQNASWTSLQTIEFERIEKTFVANGTTVNGFYYGTPTGLNSTKTYTHETDSFNENYYYRIRGEHYDQFDTSSPALVSVTDWVYGYPVGDLKEEITNNDILTGLVSGSTTLPAGGSPTGVIRCPVGDRQAIEIYLKNNETNVNLKSKFDAELTYREIDTSYFKNGDSNHNFTGVHFILPENYIVGSVGVPNTSQAYEGYPYGGIETVAAIQTGDRIEDSGGTEIKTNLYLKENSIVAGRGGNGGDSGFINISDVGLYIVNENAIKNGSAFNIPKFEIQIPEKSTVGYAGGPAIKISDSSISEFKIFAHHSSRIYGGGGGGGGGDSSFYFEAIKSMETYNTNEGKFLRDDDFDGIFFIEGDLNVSPSQALQSALSNAVTGGPEPILYAKEDLVGKTFGGAGGGGQGFISSGGIYYTQKNSGTRSRSTAGNLVSYGLGTKINYAKKIGQGGNGGEFGENGQAGPTSQRTRKMVNIRTGDSSADYFLGLTLGQKGGRAGYAIDATGNSNYNKSNFRSNLFFISQDTSISNINGFIAYWDASGLTAGDLVTWNSSLYNSDITQPTITAGLTAPVIYNSNTAKFNGNQYVLWTGTAMSAQFNNIVGSSADLLNSDISGFEIFYNMLPHTSQFENGSHLENDYIFHQWSDIGEQNQFRSYFYSSTKHVVENAGIGSFNRSFYDSNFTGTSLSLANSSFIYNISATKLNAGVISYIVSQNDNILLDDIFNNQEFSFIDNPILGAHAGSDQNMAFAISDIIIFNRRLNKNERSNVKAFLSSKNRIIKTADSSELPNINNISAEENNISLKNRLSDNNNFAGYVAFDPYP